MTVSPVFERMLSASQIEEQTIVALKKWFPTYLRELERQASIKSGTFDIPRNYDDRNVFDAEAGEELPKVVVIAPGVSGTPEKRGNGKYSATWRLGIGVAVSASTETEANMLVKGYGAVVRGIMLQNSGLGSIGAADILWVDESYDDIDIPNEISLVKSASLFFDVFVDNVVTRKPGPTTPDEAEYAYGEAQTVEIDLEQIPITDDFDTPDHP